MSARSRFGAVIAPVVALLTVGAMVVVGSQVQSPSAAAQLAPVRSEPVSGATLFCPGLLETPQALGVVGAASLSGLEVAGAAGPPRMAVQPLVDVASDASAADAVDALAETDERGQTLLVETDASVNVRADGSLAPGLAAEVTATAAGDRTAGLASQPCVEPAREWWFLAGSGQTGRRATLVLGSVADGPAVVDVEVWTEDGLLPSPGTNDLGVPARGTRTVSIDALAAGAERTAVRVRVSVGTVGAALLLREVSGADPIGLSWAGASQSPAVLSYVSGLPAFGDRVVRLANPGEQDAIATLRVLAGRGPFTPVGLEAVDVPAGSVVDVDLEPAGEEAFALEVSATAPVASAVALRQTPDSGLGDIAVVGSSAAVDEPAATRVTTQNGRTSRLVVSALPADPPTTVDDAPPTDEVGPAPATPASPTEPTDETTGFIDGTAPVVDLDVLLVDDEGMVVDENRATLEVGTTDTYPVDLPEGVDEAWVVVVPGEAGTVLAARETTTTVTVPDPLDEDSEREAFWLDLVPLASVRTTVVVPPVLPDLTAGLP